MKQPLTGVAIFVLLGIVGYNFVSYKFEQATFVIDKNGYVDENSIEEDYKAFWWLTIERKYCTFDEKEFFDEQRNYINGKEQAFIDDVSDYFTKASAHAEQLRSIHYVVRSRLVGYEAYVKDIRAIEDRQLEGNKVILNRYYSYMYCYSYLDGKRKLHQLNPVTSSYLFDYLGKDKALIEQLKEWKYYFKILELRGEPHPHLDFRADVCKFYGLEEGNI